MRSNTPVLADLAHPGTAEASKTSSTLNTMTNLRNGATWSGEKEPTRTSMPSKISLPNRPMFLTISVSTWTKVMMSQ